MLYVVNDIHGVKKLLERTIQSMSKMNAGDILVINGDGAGARGPIMNQIVKVFYEVRRGETDMSALYDEIEKVIHERLDIPREWVYDSVHAGVFRKLMALRYPLFDECMKTEAKEVLEETMRPLHEVAESKGIGIVYLPGNGEIVPDDLSVEDIKTEKAVAPEERFYWRLADDGYFFQKFGVHYVRYAVVLSGDVLLLSTNLLDLPLDSIQHMLDQLGIFKATFSKVLVHYPPAIAPIGGAFDFWTPNKTDIARSETLSGILKMLNLTDDAIVYFGHIHVGANDVRMNRYPDSMTFLTDGFSGCVWVKPGTVMKIK